MIPLRNSLICFVNKDPKKRGYNFKMYLSQDSLRKKTQRAEKVYKFIEQVGLDKIKYIKTYSATSISELIW
jgi:hypothetical protein